MGVRSLSKRLDDLSAQHGGKIPFGSMKGQGKGKGKKTTKRAGNKSKKQRRTSMKSKRRKSKGRASKGKPSMSPKDLGEKVIHRGEDGDLYEVNRGKWGKVKWGK